MVKVRMVQHSITTSKLAQLILVRVSDDDDIPLPLPSFQSSTIHNPTLPGSMQWAMGVGDEDGVVGVVEAVGTLTQAPEEQSSEATQMAPRGNFASQTPNRHRCEAQSMSILQWQLLSSKPLLLPVVVDDEEDPVQRLPKHLLLEQSQSFWQGMQEESLATHCPLTQFSEGRQFSELVHSTETQVVQL